jgi:hypothetical protein
VRAIVERVRIFMREAASFGGLRICLLLPVLVAAVPSLALDVDGPGDLQRLADSPLERTSMMIARRLLGARTR